jgi:hypothetical protein
MMHVQLYHDEIRKTRLKDNFKRVRKGLAVLGDGTRARARHQFAFLFFACLFGAMGPVGASCLKFMRGAIMC